MDSAPTIDDADSQVAEVMQQFLAVNPAPAQPAQDSQTAAPTHAPRDGPSPEHIGDRISHDENQSDQRMWAVEVPSISNAEEYEFLPGHSDIRSIISETSDANQRTLYQVKLKSGEIETVSKSL